MLIYDDPVTLADVFFQLEPIENLDVGPSVAD